MEVERISGTHATVTVSRKDLGYLKSAMNETLNAFRDSEHHTRTGKTREFGRALLDEVSAICKAIDEHK